MVPNERLANKLLALFSNISVTESDLSRIAFYAVQNARPHDEVVYRFRAFNQALEYHEQQYESVNEYQHRLF